MYANRPRRTRGRIGLINNIICDLFLYCKEKPETPSKHLLKAGVGEGVQGEMDRPCGGEALLADEGLQITLALSLHAPNQEVRERLMPIAKAYRLDDVLSACEYYYEKTKRRLTFEYAVVKGVNDNPGEAKLLSRLIGGMHGHVNLIPVNPVKERSYESPDKKDVYEFQAVLEKNGINATVRREMGRDIDGACGQLRRRYIENAGICTD